MANKGKACKNYYNINIAMLKIKLMVLKLQGEQCSLDANEFHPVLETKRINCFVYLKLQRGIFQN